MLISHMVHRALFWTCCLLLLAGYVPEAAAHPMPDIPVRASFEKEGDFEIQVEVDPRCFEADPNKAPYLVEEQRLKLTDEQRAELLTKTRAFIDRSVVLNFTAEEPLTPRFEYRFTTMENAPLTKTDDPVMITGIWRGTLPKTAKDYSITAAEGGGFSVLFLNTMLGQKVERFQVLFPGESSYKLSLRPVTHPQSALALWSAAFRASLFAGFLFVWGHGIEHLLMAVCLCLISSDRREWMAQLKVFGACLMFAVPWLHLPVPGFVPLVTAASLVLVAVLNFVPSPLRVWRILLAAPIGIAHGMLLALHYRALEPVQDAMSAALPAYLMGASGAQLTGILLLAVITQPLGHPVAYRKLVTNPLSMLIAGFGVWLFMHRLNG